MALLLQDGRDKSSSDIPPCSTLFIAHLGRTCTEDELKEVLSKYDAQIILPLSGYGSIAKILTIIVLHCQGTRFSCP